MRQILFKAKRIDNGEWVEGYYQENPKGYVHIQNSSMDCFPVNPKTICQYTGLTDKNGNKIWENDVVRQFADCNELGHDLYFFYQIKWNEEYARFYGEEIYCKEVVLFDELEDIEVIGNIFDNPELIKECD